MKILASSKFQLSALFDDITESDAFDSTSFPAASTNCRQKKKYQSCSFIDSSSPRARINTKGCSISRPRNKFIISRNILSKYLKSEFNKVTTDNISKVSSIIWRRSEECFQMYFQYLAFLEDAWHQSYHPTYMFSPKKSEVFRSTKLGNCSGIISVSPNLATDIKEISKSISTKVHYTTICTSSYKTLSSPSSDSGRNPKKFARMRFSSNANISPRVKKASRQGLCMAKSSDKDHYFHTSRRFITKGRKSDFESRIYPSLCNIITEDIFLDSNHEL